MKKKFHYELVVEANDQTEADKKTLALELLAEGIRTKLLNKADKPGGADEEPMILTEQEKHIVRLMRQFQSAFGVFQGMRA